MFRLQLNANPHDDKFKVNYQFDDNVYVVDDDKPEHEHHELIESVPVMSFTKTSLNDHIVKLESELKQKLEYATIENKLEDIKEEFDLWIASMYRLIQSFFTIKFKFYYEKLIFPNDVTNNQSNLRQDMKLTIDQLDVIRDTWLQYENKIEHELSKDDLIKAQLDYSELMKSLERDDSLQSIKAIVHKLNTSTESSEQNFKRYYQIKFKIYHNLYNEMIRDILDLFDNFKSSLTTLKESFTKDVMKIDKKFKIEMYNQQIIQSFINKCFIPFAKANNIPEQEFMTIFKEDLLSDQLRYMRRKIEMYHDDKPSLKLECNTIYEQVIHLEQDINASQTKKKSFVKQLHINMIEEAHAILTKSLTKLGMFIQYYKKSIEKHESKLETDFAKLENLDQDIQIMKRSRGNQNRLIDVYADELLYQIIDKNKLIRTLRDVKYNDLKLYHKYATFINNIISQLQSNQGL